MCKALNSIKKAMFCIKTSTSNYKERPTFYEISSAFKPKPYIPCTKHSIPSKKPYSPSKQALGTLREAHVL